METFEQNIGELVVCDFCNADGKESKGGVLVGSYAICGKCTDKHGYLKDDYEYKDEIAEVFDKDKTFQENVLAYREKTYGTRDGFTQVTGW